MAVGKLIGCNVGTFVGLTVVGIGERGISWFDGLPDGTVDGEEEGREVGLCVGCASSGRGENVGTPVSTSANAVG